MTDRLLAITLVVLVILVGGLLYMFFIIQDDVPGVAPGGEATFVKAGMETFTSAEDFQAYLADAPSSSVSFSPISPQATGRDDEFVIEDIGTSVGLGSPEAKSSQTVERVSETNVQVQGIDEPDIVKTDGTSLFISEPDYGPYYYTDDLLRGTLTPSEGTGSSNAEVPVASDDTEVTTDEKLIAPDSISPPVSSAETKIITAFPIDALAKIGSIAENGDLLRSDNVLMIFLSDKVVAYDVATPSAPVKLWTLAYAEQQSLVTARLMDGKVYLITQGYVNRTTPCPIEPMMLDTKPVSIPCGEIYHPVTPVNVDVTYAAVVVNPEDGSTLDSVAFVGAQSSTIVYMSQDALYTAYARSNNYYDVVINFTLTDGASLFPESFRTNLSRVQALDISDEAKSTEYTVLFDRYLAGLGDEEQSNFQNSYEDRFQQYLQQHVRELDSSGIVKIGLSDFSVSATGEVPGYLLNQFSIDEFDGNLRVATTSGSGFGLEESVNDVYVLDEKLKTVGSALNMGLGERIYSARFLGNRGYVVTFKQTDPFYVLDLSDPRSPKQTGELKIPGFSSYLDPLTDSLVLGVGEENSNTKLSLFNVQDPSNPTEAAQYQLDAYWTGIQESHHAFLHDAKHSAFFVPAGADGYVFTYTPTAITLVKKVTNIQASRAVYINDVLYVIGANEIVLLDESTWDQVASLAL